MYCLLISSRLVDFISYFYQTLKKLIIISLFMHSRLLILYLLLNLYYIISQFYINMCNNVYFIHEHRYEFPFSQLPFVIMFCIALQESRPNYYLWLQKSLYAWQQLWPLLALVWLRHAINTTTWWFRHLQMHYYQGCVSEKLPHSRTSNLAKLGIGVRQ